jgi:hypothetical protein
MTEVSQHDMIRPEEEKQREMSTDLSAAHPTLTTDEIRGEQTAMNNGHAGEPIIPLDAAAEPGSSSEIAPESHSSSANANPHAEAGRKGARRIHQLIQQGRLYEREHSLKPGRQRLRQLIAEGKLYEQERGLKPRKGRHPRMSQEQTLKTFLQALLRMVKPAYRTPLLGLMQALETERT